MSGQLDTPNLIIVGLNEVVDRTEAATPFPNQGLRAIKKTDDDELAYRDSSGTMIYYPSENRLTASGGSFIGVAVPNVTATNLNAALDEINQNAGGGSFVTTNTTQTGLTGNKTWQGEHTFNNLIKSGTVMQIQPDGTIYWNSSTGKIYQSGNNIQVATPSGAFRVDGKIVVGVELDTTSGATKLGSTSISALGAGAAVTPLALDASNNVVAGTTSGQVEEIVPGLGIDVDNTDPTKPEVSIESEYHNAWTNTTNTGLIEGLKLQFFNTTQFKISVGHAHALDRTDPENAVIDGIDVTTPITHTLLNIANAPITFIGLESDGLGGAIVKEYSTQDSSRKYQGIVMLGAISHTPTEILSAIPLPNLAFSPMSHLQDMYNYIGLMRKGVTVSPAGGNLKLDVSSGSLFELFGNYYNNVDKPNEVDVASASGISFTMTTPIDISQPTVTDVDVNNYFNTSTQSITSIPNNDWVFHRVFIGANGEYFVVYGNNVYGTRNQALEAYAEDQDSFENHPLLSSRQNAHFLCTILVQEGETDLSNLDFFITLEPFGLGGSNSGGGAGGQVDSVAGGDGIDVDATDPINPSVAVDSTVARKNIDNNFTSAQTGIDPTLAQHLVTKAYGDANYSGGQVDSVTGGDGVNVNSADPANPDVSVNSTVARKDIDNNFAERQSLVKGLDFTGTADTPSGNGEVSMNTANDILAYYLDALRRMYSTLANVQNGVDLQDPPFGISLYNNNITFVNAPVGITNNSYTVVEKKSYEATTSVYIIEVWDVQANRKWWTSVYLGTPSGVWNEVGTGGVDKKFFPLDYIRSGAQSGAFIGLTTHSSFTSNAPRYFDNERSWKICCFNLVCGTFLANTCTFEVHFEYESPGVAWNFTGTPLTSVQFGPITSGGANNYVISSGSINVNIPQDVNVFAYVKLISGTYTLTDTAINVDIEEQ